MFTAYHRITTIGYDNTAIGIILLFVICCYTGYILIEYRVRVYAQLVIKEFHVLRGPSSVTKLKIYLDLYIHSVVAYIAYHLYSI